MPAPTLIAQTTYAELLDRSRATAFSEAFPEDGSFVSKTIKERRYWYFQEKTEEGREQKYVGPETPELLEQIAQHKQTRDDERERRTLVSALIRSFGLPRPTRETADVVAALARAGVFRLRGVLVGTVAYQTYPAMLGVRLPQATLQTGDVDIAQFQNVSVAVDEQTPPVIELLRSVDKTFRPVPHTQRRNVTSYIAKGGLRVDFLTPNEGADTNLPRPLRAFQTDAEPLRFLDFLIHDPEPAVLLHDAGVYVLVPSPERFAIHKLIVSRRRRPGTAKQNKDVQQSESLLNVLHEKQPYELKSAWGEAYGRGPSWQKLLVEGLSQTSGPTRDKVLKTVERPRNIIPGLTLAFDDSAPRYDSERGIVIFVGKSGKGTVRCAITREALDDNFGSTAGLSNQQQTDNFQENRSLIEGLAREKYLNWPVEEPPAVLIRSTEVAKMLAKPVAIERHASSRKRGQSEAGEMPSRLQQHSFENMGPLSVLPAPTFFAIYPNANDAARVALIADGLRRQYGLKGRLRPLHLSLHYLGELAALPKSKIEEACRIASSIAFPPFEITFDRVMSFKGGPNGAPVVMLGSDGVAAVEEFWRRLGFALRQAKLLRGRATRFIPHVTLLYDKRKVEEQPVEPFRWMVREFHLAQSLVGRGEHVALASWPLAGSANSISDLATN